MFLHRTLVLGVATLVLVGCNPFKRSPVVEVSTADANLNTRWHGTLASPTALAGVVQMSGSAAMSPGSNDRTTDVTLDLVNATPGGTHPWGLHRGHCSTDEGLLGQPSEYKAIEVGDDGRANATANIDLDTPTSGSYSVRVTASTANSDMIIACANLAPPSM